MAAGSLPASCEVCAYAVRRDKLHCTRHAPAPGRHEYEVAHWPLVPPSARCGQGSADSRAEVVGYTCGTCIHWFRPDDGGLVPDHRAGLAREWWAEAGLCTRLSPSPSAEEDQSTAWKVTHTAASCGDGTAMSLYR